jgi:Methyltransferase domain
MRLSARPASRDRLPSKPIVPSRPSWLPSSSPTAVVAFAEPSNLEQALDQIEFIEADVEALPFDDASFDLCVSGGAKSPRGRARSVRSTSMRQDVSTAVGQTPPGQVCSAVVVALLEPAAVHQFPQTVSHTTGEDLLGAGDDQGARDD